MSKEGTANVYVERQMADAVVHEFTEACAAVYSSSPAYPNGTNQDAAAVVAAKTGGVVIVVADGAGGLPSGHRASALAVQTLSRTVEAALAEARPLRSAILDGFDLANRAILELGIGAASTLAVLQIEEGILRPYHVGDSSVLAVGQRGKIKLLTMSHSPVGYQVEAGVLRPEEALHHADRNFVSNLVGSTDMRIEVGAPIRLARYDTVVVGSDGLFDNLRAKEIVTIVRKGPVAKAAAQLVKRCTKRMLDPEEGQPSKPDDLTFVIYRGKARSQS